MSTGIVAFYGLSLKWGRVSRGKMARWRGVGKNVGKSGRAIANNSWVLLLKCMAVEWSVQLTLETRYLNAPIP